MIDGKVDNQSSASEHESPYNIRTSTLMGFSFVFGYSRFKDQGSTTHAWVSWSEGFEEWQRQMAVDFLCNIVGYRGPFNNDGLSRVSSRSRELLSNKIKEPRRLDSRRRRRPRRRPIPQRKRRPRNRLGQRRYGFAWIRHQSSAPRASDR